MMAAAGHCTFSFPFLAAWVTKRRLAIPATPCLSGGRSGTGEGKEPGNQCAEVDTPRVGLPLMPVVKLRFPAAAILPRRQIRRMRACFVGGEVDLGVVFGEVAAGLLCFLCSYAYSGGGMSFVLPLLCERVALCAGIPATGGGVMLFRSSVAAADLSSLPILHMLAADGCSSIMFASWWWYQVPPLAASSKFDAYYEDWSRIGICCERLPADRS
jgi:hypothetical protein